jgi:ABC-type multidrug transport system fused ATPase/permease subunit
VRMANLVAKTTLEYSVFKNGETPLRRILDIAAIGVMLLLAFRAMQAGELTFQGFVLFMLVVRLTIAPISALAQALTRLQGGLGSARRVLEFLGREPVVVDGPRTDAQFKREIKLENVTFGYAADTPVFTGLNLTLKKGELLAIVGTSGAGKSTLVDLILRLYDPGTGRMTVDGVDVRQFNQESYRRLFGVVSQESLLFNESIADNIIFGRATGNDADLRRAADIANASEFISGLPEGFDTFVGDRGVRLSGGQRQRIAIARAIYASPPILILDEATSALDSGSERLVQQAIDRVLTTATAVVIAHRLSTILHADRIVVLDNGRIEAVDTHDALLATSPTYQRLYDLQFRSTSAPSNA